MYCKIAKDFNYFSFEFLKDKNIFKFEDEYSYLRIGISRLYYAYFWFYLDKYPDIANSKSSNKHNLILQKSNDNLFKTLQDLRIWADYKICQPPKGTEKMLKNYQMRVFKKLKNC